MSHLLDTNSFIDHLRRGPASNVTSRLAAAPPGSVYLCSIVLAELWHRSPERATWLATVLEGTAAANVRWPGSAVQFN